MSQICSGYANLRYHALLHFWPTPVQVVCGAGAATGLGAGAAKTDVTAAVKRAVRVSLKCIFFFFLVGCRRGCSLSVSLKTAFAILLIYQAASQAGKSMGNYQCFRG